MAKKVMVVDDDYTMNSLLKMLLEFDGYSVIVVAEGSLVLEKARQEKPDVILMDVHIGDADGLELLREIRSDPAIQSMPVVMASGLDVEDRCKAAGASAFVLKPYPPEQLTAIFKKVLA
ncbi:MAG: response regulator [Anaerolineales bacterium]